LILSESETAFGPTEEYQKGACRRRKPIHKNGLWKIIASHEVNWRCRRFAFPEVRFVTAKNGFLENSEFVGLGRKEDLADCVGAIWMSSS